MPRITLETLTNIDYEYVASKITEFTRKIVEESGAAGVVVGLSGGVDSSVTACLMTRALGKSKVVGVIMPYRTTPPEDVEDARHIAESLGIEYYTVDITGIRDAFAHAIPIFDESHRIACGNLLPRIRMTILYYFANKMNLLVAGTGDKSELLIGYFTKYGDGGVDFLPIGDLYKTQVRHLALRLGLPQRIAFKPSSPRLWPGHLAEEELGTRYDDIDVVLFALFDLGLPIEKAAEETGKPVELVRLVWYRHVKSRHKRTMPPTPGLSMRDLVKIHG